MNRTERLEIIVRHVKNLIEKYANDEKTQQEFCDEVERVYFSGEELNPFDYYAGADATSIASWRQKMPKMSGDNVKVEEDNEDSIILHVTGNDVVGVVAQARNVLYTVITDKVIEELYTLPEIIALNTISIGNGDGDEGCIYFEF